MTDLSATARALFAEGKGILAADESVPTAEKRLKEHGIEDGEEMRRNFRDLFLGAEGIEQYLSGVILFEETFGQKGKDRKLFPNMLSARGIAPGIKVDTGTEPLPHNAEEFITNGLLGLPERLQEFAKKGAVFTKWRAVIKIEGNRLPTNDSLVENAKRLSTYAKEVQEAGLVPMVEPEVLLAGTHSRLRAKEVIIETLSILFNALEEQAVDMSGLILKTAMTLSGDASRKKDTPEEVAEDTVSALVASVPKRVAGIMFLSGGQTPDQATENLGAIVRRAKRATVPWPLTFSYARALQDEALNVWKGREENVEAARGAFLARLTQVSAALTSTEV